MRQEQIFGILSKGGKVPKVKSRVTGCLCVDGLIVEHNKPFAVLSMLRKSKYGHINKKRIKVVAMIQA